MTLGFFQQTIFAPGRTGVKKNAMGLFFPWHSSYIDESREGASLPMLGDFQELTGRHSSPATTSFCLKYSSSLLPPSFMLRFFSNINEK